MSLSLGGKGVAFTTPRCCGNEVAGLKPRQPTALPMEDFTSPEVSEESSGKFRQQNNRVKSDCYALKTKDFPIMSLIPKWFTHLHATVGKQDKMDDENPQTSTLCKGMIADLECICRAYVFNYEKIDHDVIIDRLYEIIQQSKCLRDNPALFSDMEEYRRFKEKIIDLAQTITCIIKMWEDRNTKRAEIQEKMRHKHDPYYAIPPSSRVIARSPFSRSQHGIHVFKMEIKDLGIRPFVEEDAWVTFFGDEDIQRIGKFAGLMGGRLRARTMPGFQNYILRQWILGEAKH
ncbi:hypothetical protein M8818_005504 [Zalaria obscura]|uniref:Uncharacterized protein n=1 Tax=Zalaria obscura TaxID=2024903 RepID=A0ACC3S8K0_9PEZI